MITERMTPTPPSMFQIAGLEEQLFLFLYSERKENSLQDRIPKDISVKGVRNIQ